MQKICPCCLRILNIKNFICKKLKIKSCICNDCKKIHTQNFN